MLNRSASLAMSTSVLKALPGKLDIKRHSPSILYLIQEYHDYCDVLLPIKDTAFTASRNHRYVKKLLSFVKNIQCFLQTVSSCILEKLVCLMYIMA